MSDSIDALNKIVHLGAQRNDPGELAIPDFEQTAVDNFKLLEKIVIVAGDAFEDHVAARNRAKPRKERVYREIVRQIAEHFCDQVDTVEHSFDIEVAVREILAAFDIETVDFTGRAVKIV